MAIKSTISFETLRSAQKPKIPIIVVFGPGGRGKSTLAAGAPNPVFLAVEDGLGSLDVPSWRITSYKEAIDALLLLAGGQHQFQTVVIDSLDWLEPLIWDQACRDQNWTNIEDPGYGKGYIHALRYWREIIDALKYLRDHLGMIGLMIAHHQIKRFDDPANEPYDQYRLKLQERAAGLVEEAADVVGFLNYRVTIQRSKQDFGETVTRGAGGEQRILFVDGRPAFVAKNRYEAMPNQIELPSTKNPAQIWAKLGQYMPQPTPLEVEEVAQPERIVEVEKKTEEEPKAEAPPQPKISKTKTATKTAA